MDEPSPEESFRIWYGEVKYMVANFEHVKAQRVDMYDGERMERSNRAVRHFEGLIDKLCHGRKFNASSNRYLGWVPEETKQGDLICIFKGSDVPYILRPFREGRYILIGESYIHGIMEGERLAGGRLEQEFNTV